MVLDFLKLKFNKLFLIYLKAITKHGHDLLLEELND